MYQASDEPFDGPAVLQKIGGQVIEQFGMRWWITAHTEIAGCADQPLAEMNLPDSVDQDPGG